MVDPGQGRSNAQGTQYSYSLLSSDYFCHTSGLMEKVRNVLNTIPVFSKPTSQKSELAAVNIEKLIESSYFQYSYFSLSSIDCLEGPALVFPFHDFT